MHQKPRALTFNTRFLILSAVLLLATGLWSAYSQQYPSSPFGDDLTEHTPDRIYDGSVYRQGHLPLWNPYLFSGIDQPSVIQPGVFYPPNVILYALFSGVVAHNLMIVGHLLLSFYFLRQFLKLHNLTDWAATLGALTLILGSTTICFIEGVPNSNARVWVLASFYFFERWILSRRLIFCAWTGACFALVLLAGWPQMVVLGGVYLLLYAVMSLPGYLKKKWLIAGFVGAFLFSAALALIQILPTLELKRHSNLSELSYAFFGTCAVPPVLFVQMLIPFLFGMGKWPFTVPWLGPVNVYVMQIYVGVLPLLLAPVSLFFWRKSRLVRFGSVAFVMSLLLAAGTHTPLGHLLYRIPAYNFFRDHYMHFFFTTFAIAILTAAATSELDLGKVNEHLRKRLSQIVPALFVLAFAIILLARHSLFRILTAGPHAWWPDYIRDAHISLKPYNPATLAALAVMLLSFIPFWLKLRYPRSSRINWLIAGAFVLVMGPYDALIYAGPSAVDPPAHDKAILKRLRELSSPAADRVYSIERSDRFLHIHNNQEIPAADIMGYGSLFPYPYTNLLELGGDGRSPVWAELILNHRILSLLNVRYVLANSDQVQHLQKMMPISGAVPVPPQPLQSPGEEALSPEQWAACSSLAKTNRVQIGKDEIRGVDGTLQCEFAVQNNSLYQLSFNYWTTQTKEKTPLEVAFGGPKGPRATVISGNLLPNQPAPFTIVQPVIDGATSAELKFSTGSHSANEISNVNVRRITDLPLAGSYYQIVEQGGDVLMLQNHDVLPRAFFVREVQPVKNFMEARARLWNMTDSLDLRTTALVEGDPPTSRADLGRGEVRELRYGPSSVRVKVQCERECYLVLTDRFDPGWKATIDGADAEIFATNGVVRGLFVPDGEHLVEFRYEPKYYGIPMWISGLSGLALLLATVIAWRRGDFVTPADPVTYLN